MAVSDTLQRHERMMAVLRSTLAQWHGIQELLGRRWEHLYASSTADPDAMVESCRQVYIAMAQELHRKQCMARNILDAVDDLLYDDARNDMDVECTSRAVAQRCVDAWPRTHKESFLRPHVALLQAWQEQSQSSVQHSS
jgi:hypothetical protein